jgi:hypothetical protein
VRIERLEYDASKMALGLLSAMDLSAAAARALEDGFDSASLRILAGSTALEPDEAGAMFERSLAEIGVPKPSKRDAVMRLARDVANGILSGATAPYQGAKEIWELSLRIPEEGLAELDSFVYAASEWEGRPEDRDVLEDGITAAAREFVSARQS